MSSELSVNQERAALLMADDLQSDEQIAAVCGVVKRTIARWRTLPAFQERIAEHRRVQALAIRDEGIANKQNRIARLNHDWQRMQRLLDAREAAGVARLAAEQQAHRDAGVDTPFIARIPGEDTGLVVRDEKLGQWWRREFDQESGARLRAHRPRPWLPSGDRAEPGDFGVRVVHKQGRRWKTVHIFDAADVGRLAKEVA